MARRHLYLQWDSTDECNLHCKHCYHNAEGNSEHTQTKKQMSLEEVFSMIDDLKATSIRWNMLPRIALSGGEPFMRKDLMDILDYTQKEKVVSNILTNGTLITPEKAREIKRREVHTVQISLDGKKKTHNSIRGCENAYDLAIRGIRNCSAEDIPVVVATTLMKSNMCDFEEVIISAWKAGAQRVGFKTYVPDPQQGLNDPEFVRGLEAYQMIQKTNELVDKYSGKIRVLQSDVLWQIMDDGKNELIQKSKQDNTYLWGCSAGFRMLTVLSDGTVYPCRRLPIPIGNIKEGFANLVLHSEVMKNLRDLKKMKEKTLCDKVVHCRGCRAVAYAVTGDYLAKDPMCFKEYLK